MQDVALQMHPKNVRGFEELSPPFSRTAWSQPALGADETLSDQSGAAPSNAASSASKAVRMPAEMP